MLTHLFTPVHKFGMWSGQIQMFVVSPALRTLILVPHLKNAKTVLGAKGVAVRDIELLSTCYCREFRRGSF